MVDQEGHSRSLSPGFSYFWTSDGPAPVRESMFHAGVRGVPLPCRSPSTQWLEGSSPSRLPAEVARRAPQAPLHRQAMGLPQSTSSSGRWHDQDWTNHLPVCR
jgi:hypothetical protein